jgi:type IV pilus assembly protein PilN
MIDNQLERNAMLRKEILLVDARLAEIKRLDEIRERLVARMEQIRALQSSRPESVHLMDELAFIMPQGVVLTSVKQNGRSVSLEGIAQSNAQISALMDKVDLSAWLTKPELKLISTGKGLEDGLSHFSLAMQQESPTEEER